jgi:NAD(P)H-flavin reductase
MKCVTLGNYAKITLSHQHTPIMVPGQSVLINGRYYALADLRDNELDIVTQCKYSRFFVDDIVIELPIGQGFTNLNLQSAVCIAAGTGLGAVISLVKYRHEKNLSTQVQIYGRNITKQLVTAAFPILNNVEFNVWNTTELGRPIIKNILPDDPEVPVFFAGPKGFLDEIKLVTRQEIILNF